MKARFLVAQLGARMHYAVPQVLHQAGILEHFYTDIVASQGWPAALRLIPPVLRSQGIKRLLGRNPRGLPQAKITAFTGMGFDYIRRQKQARTLSEQTAVYLWAGTAFNEAILKRGFGNATGVYAFNSAGLELLQNARKRRLLTVLEQTIAPKEVEHQLIVKEYERFPGWESSPEQDDCWQEYADRERAEWNCADLILCGSGFVRDSIQQCGGPRQLCRIVPYGIDATYPGLERARLRSRPLRVLTIGRVGLRKGTPYILQAAQLLKGRAEFRMVGPVDILPEARRQLEAHVQVMGAIPRSEIRAHYAWADVFVFPSLCEGSATVCYEALAAGLPVITTPNAGSVVRDGIDGFLVPVRNYEAIIEALERLFTNPDLLTSMSSNALQRSKDFTISKYGERLLNTLATEDHTVQSQSAEVYQVNSFVK